MGANKSCPHPQPTSIMLNLLTYSTPAQTTHSVYKLCPQALLKAWALSANRILKLSPKYELCQLTVRQKSSHELCWQIASSILARSAKSMSSARNAPPSLTQVRTLLKDRTQNLARDTSSDAPCFTHALLVLQRAHPNSGGSAPKTAASSTVLFPGGAASVVPAAMCPAGGTTGTVACF